jgi:hypothetical protein
MARHRPLVADDDRQDDRLVAVLGRNQFLE